ncbi:MAG: sugar transferase, partial [Chloroflexi bacterium]|nr:sugar transferase [Chloroflexota bacterium]
MFPPGIPLSKRMFDLAMTTIGLIVFSPFLALLALLVRKYLGKPVLFRQTRPGYHGKPFELIKFRTMTDQRDTKGRLLSDSQRLTRFGHFLR